MQVPSSLSLYIHIPYCVNKCPYCDFNSHARTFSESQYVQALIADLEQDARKIEGRTVKTIFIGGGTPSLFSSKAIETLLIQLYRHLSIDTSVEITLECNPGTINYQRLRDFRSVGITRLSIGVQSFDEGDLKRLGRIHTKADAINAIKYAQAAHFSNINVDMMFGLPEQTVEKAIADIQQVAAFQISHISYYQLTIEPNTAFFQKPPKLPDEEIIDEIQFVGQQYLHQQGYEQYEISAYAREQQFCQHNLNYWHFGDYLGIGAGAHSKITTTDSIIRFSKLTNPEHYIYNANTPEVIAQTTVLTTEDLCIEFMMNALRLHEGFTTTQFTATTGLDITLLNQPLEQAYQQGWLVRQGQRICTTEMGKRFLNEVLGLFI